MERAKMKVRICLIFVVMLAVILGIVYYYKELSDDKLEGEGTLITMVPFGCETLCR